ncbi:V4R domain-containing protein [uncultured Methanoregula sp.]|uniref:V4R domain-containing protein n=1 Tax=uncultured Methanoregula sp. TaxID=1005933 RepID=UPI002AAB6366|nr:V4R domain-containing protein [uncultured Methanoregula sp.]
MQSQKDSGTDISAGEVRLFSTRDNVVAVESPIKVRILGLVSNGPVAFDRIVEQTQKAKSTISVHIRDLERAGLIVSQPDPRDSRRRFIALSSSAIGRLTNRDRGAKSRRHVHRHGEHDEPFSDDDIVSFFRYCVKVFRTQAMAIGINIDPVLQRTGAEVGCVLAPRIAGRSVAEVVRKMDAFWQAHSLGAITLAGTDPLTIEVHGCFECEDLPVTGHGACAFDIGVLTEIFSHHLQCPVTVVEERCYSSGDDRCIFVITRQPDPV